jgi:hypothetical protein
LYWDIWIEGDLAGTHKAFQLNKVPIQAAHFGDAIAKFASEHPDRELFVQGPFGWTYKGCMIYDAEYVARVSMG